MFVQATHTYSNPATVAALIRVNGLNSVVASRVVPAEVLRHVRESARRDGACEMRRKLCCRRQTPLFRAMMKAARRHGPECLHAAANRPHGARMVSGLLDAWSEGCGAGEISRRHGWAIGRQIGAMSRAGIRHQADRIGLDLVAASMPLDPNFRYDSDSPVLRRTRAYKRVMARTCRLFGVTATQLKGDGRCRELAVPRHFFAYWCKHLVKMSFPEIGRKLGGRDHTTALNSVRKWPESRDEARQIIAARRLTGACTSPGGRR